MTDANLRALERTAHDHPERFVAAARRVGPREHLAALIRVGWVSAQQAAVLAFCRDGAARAMDDPAMWRFCSECGESDFDAGCEILAGDELASPETIGRSYCGACFFGSSPDENENDWRGKPSMATWATALLPLLRDLPDPEGVTVPCGGCFKPRWIGPDTDWSEPMLVTKERGTKRAHKITCTGRVPYAPTPEERQRWYAVLVAEAVGRAVLPGWEEGQGVCHWAETDELHTLDCLGCPGDWDAESCLSELHGDLPLKAPRQALDTVRAWLAEPTEERLNRWREACSGCQGFPGWVPCPNPADCGSAAWLSRRLASAADLGVDVRAVALEALRPWSGGPRLGN